MKEATLVQLRNSKDFFMTDEIIHIRDGRKREDIGYFVPQKYFDQFDTFVRKIEEDRKLALLQKIAEAQRCDPIEEGSVDDGLE